MREKKIKTLFELIKANKSFSCALNKGLYPEIDIYIALELIFIYFNSNMSLLKEYDLNTYEFISYLLYGKEYYIEDNKIHFNDNEYDVKYFIDLINALEEYKRQGIVIPKREFVAHQKDSGQSSNNECKIYVFSDYRKLSMYEMSERELVFQYTTRVDDVTKPYINHVMINFKRFINEVVINCLNGLRDKVSLKELSILNAYINFFPLFNYGSSLVEFPFERLAISDNEIGIAKITYDNKEVVDANKKYNKVKDKIEEVSYREALAVGSEYADAQMLYRLRRKLSTLKKEEVDLLYQIYELTHLEHIFNPTLLKSVWESFINGTVDINTLFNNPVLRLFVIKDNVTKFYSAMHLDTLLKLIDNDTILEVLNSDHRLILENK